MLPLQWQPLVRLCRQSPVPALPHVHVRPLLLQSLRLLKCPLGALSRDGSVALVRGTRRNADAGVRAEEYHTPAAQQLPAPGWRLGSSAEVRLGGGSGAEMDTSARAGPGAAASRRYLHHQQLDSSSREPIARAGAAASLASNGMLGGRQQQRQGARDVAPRKYAQLHVAPPPSIAASGDRGCRSASDAELDSAEQLPKRWRPADRPGIRSPRQAARRQAEEEAPQPVPAPHRMPALTAEMSGARAQASSVSISASATGRRAESVSGEGLCQAAPAPHGHRAALSAPAAGGPHPQLSQGGRGITRGLAECVPETPDAPGPLSGSQPPALGCTQGPLEASLRGAEELVPESEVQQESVPAPLSPSRARPLPDSSVVADTPVPHADAESMPPEAIGAGPSAPSLDVPTYGNDAAVQFPGRQPRRNQGVSGTSSVVASAGGLLQAPAAGALRSGDLHSAEARSGGDMPPRGTASLPSTAASQGGRASAREAAPERGSGTQAGTQPPEAAAPGVSAGQRSLQAAAAKRAAEEAPDEAAGDVPRVSGSVAGQAVLSWQVLGDSQAEQPSSKRRKLLQPPEQPHYSETVSGPLQQLHAAASTAAAASHSASGAPSAAGGSAGEGQARPAAVPPLEGALLEFGAPVHSMLLSPDGRHANPPSQTLSMHVESCTWDLLMDMCRRSHTWHKLRGAASMDGVCDH